MRRPILTIGASALALCAFAAPSLAHNTADPTTVTITVVNRPAGDVFRGRVGSANPDCIEDRLVQLFRVQPGADLLIDTDESEDNGAWDIDIEGGAPAGRYYVRLPGRVLTSPGHRHVCRGGRSAFVTAP